MLILEAKLCDEFGFAWVTKMLDASLPEIQ